MRKQTETQMNASIKNAIKRHVTIVDVYVDQDRFGDMVCFQRRGQPYVAPYSEPEVLGRLTMFGADAFVANGINCQFHISDNVPADVAAAIREHTK